MVIAPAEIVEKPPDLFDRHTAPESRDVVKAFAVDYQICVLQKRRLK